MPIHMKDTSPHLLPRLLTSLIICLLWPTFLSQSPLLGQDKKMALVVGNARYKHGLDLKHPVSDAYLLGFTLEDLGFQVSSLTNASKEEMEKALVDFWKQAAGAETALFYYAGHGMRQNGVNYLIPVDARMKNSRDIKGSGVDLHGMLGEFARLGAQTKLLVLDASPREAYAPWVGEANGGFEAMEVPENSILAFSTQPASTAAERGTSNGLYTEKLTQQMVLPQSLTDLFRHTGMLVSHATGQQQNPQFWGEVDPTLSLAAGYIPGAAGSGSIMLSSELSGVVILNGLEIGSVTAGGSLPLDKMEEGSYSLEILGEIPWKEDVLVLAGQVSNVRALPPKPSTGEARAADSLSQGEFFVDTRDQQRYTWAWFGEQAWMTQNLNYASDQSRCYDGKDENCQIYGRLYPWEAATEACPEGWHLPSDEEWMVLERMMGMKKMASKSFGHRGKPLGEVLKDSLSGSWTPSQKHVVEVNGFHALPAGYDLKEGKSVEMGESTYFWTATKTHTFEAAYRKLKDGQAGIHRYEDRLEQGFSVRCVMDGE